MHCRRGTKNEITGVGFDENLALIGGTAYDQPYDIGVPIPPTKATDPSRRYLILAAPVLRVGAHEVVRITGLRQYLEIGGSVTSASGCSYPLSLEVTSRSWSFTDGNVSWHLQRVQPMTLSTQHPANTEGFQHLYAQTPALLFQNTPADAGGYFGPNGGLPWGAPLIPDLGTFTDIRFRGQCCDAWNALDIEEQGPCDIALFASVLQTTPAERCKLELPVAFPTGILKPEDAFVFNVSALQNLASPGVVYTRVGGSIIYERENLVSEPRQLVEPIANMGCIKDSRME